MPVGDHLSNNGSINPSWPGHYRGRLREDGGDQLEQGGAQLVAGGRPGERLGTVGLERHRLGINLRSEGAEP